jgi:cob(I)alamin adenosyltransferase
MNLQLCPGADGIGISKNYISKIVICRTTGSIHETTVTDNQCEETSVHAACEIKLSPFRKNNQRKVYSGKGDRGQCSLLSGDRIMKDAEQVEAYGDIDELNSVLGLLVSILPQNALWLLDEIEQIQNLLFNIGALVATDLDSSLLKRLEPISVKHIQSLEKSIDAMGNSMEEIQSFIIPGGHFSAAQAHVARSVCRRAERHVIKYFKKYNLEELPEPMKNVLVYLNRLSDYLFILSRFCNFMQDVQKKRIRKGSKSLEGILPSLLNHRRQYTFGNPLFA